MDKTVFGDRRLRLLSFFRLRYLRRLSFQASTSWSRVTNVRSLVRIKGKATRLTEKRMGSGCVCVDDGGGRLARYPGGITTSEHCVSSLWSGQSSRMSHLCWMSMQVPSAQVNCLWSQTERVMLTISPLRRPHTSYPSVQGLVPKGYSSVVMGVQRATAPDTCHQEVAG